MQLKRRRKKMKFLTSSVEKKQSNVGVAKVKTKKSRIHMTCCCKKGYIFKYGGREGGRKRLLLSSDLNIPI